MDTVGQGLSLHTLLHLSDALGDVFIGQQHKLFDKLCGIVRFLEIGSNWFTFFVNVEVQLLTVELYRTALEATLTQAFCQLVECS